MSKKAIFLSVFFLILFIGFYFGLRAVIPGFGKVALPVLSSVQPFSFTDQEGRQVTQRDVAGKVYVAEYFFTTCKGMCPLMNANIKKVYLDFVKEPEFRILSHTVDPQTDSVSRMKRYADSLGADPSQWRFLTGRKDSLYRMARNSYLLDDPKNNAENPDEQFIHTQFVALVDKQGRVRKIYDCLKEQEIVELEKDIRGLLKETAASPGFGTNVYQN
ncbi:MAG: SCO family protein [Bacteroidota bacterium]|nr:SCO family protein [Bacteroidota bacterium]MDP4214669.1 SCO family protein [Bacteroidota bacterium]MDP4244360.1 SCO family protein [Bacteroidota bacterium]MDP4255701.1 SCO family protein [Bacteroidota bacterium]MDP4258922.1 SCO family protein [Bacteroidota bacterium]